MQQQSDTYDIKRSATKQQNRIRHHRIISMQRVKANAASVGLENRRGKQMIQIHQHCRKQYQIDFFPVFSEKTVSNKQRKAQMQKVVYECLHARQQCGENSYFTTVKRLV